MNNKKTLLIVIAFVLLAVAIGTALLLKNKNNISYTVVFNTNGGTIIDNQIIKRGEKLLKPNDPIKENFVFIEWQYNNKTFDFSSEINTDIVLNAIWIEKAGNIESYVVKFETDGGTTISNQIIEKNKIIIKPIDPMKEGYKFVGWYYNNDEFDFDTLVIKNLQLTAKWEKINTTTNSSSNNNNISSNNSEKTKYYTITFNSNGGSSVSSQRVIAGGKVPEPFDPTKNGYTFAGWTLNGNAYNFSSTVNGNITLIAKWTENAKPKYTVTFNSNGGSSVSSQQITEGNMATKPIDPTKNGYTFVGWTLNGNAYNFSSTVNGNITLVAKWTENAKSKYTVTFNSNGGSSVSSQQITEGNMATKPTEPTKSGYTFSGWMLNGNAYNFSSAVNGNIILIAKWVQKNYRITATPVDSYSPDRILGVKEDGNIIAFSAIKYSDGTVLCNGSNPTVSFSDILGETSFIVVLTDGTPVNATLN